MVSPLDCFAAMLAIKRLAGVAPEVSLPRANKVAHSGFETKRRCHKKSKTVTYKRTCVHQQCLKKEKKKVKRKVKRKKERKNVWFVCTGTALYLQRGRIESSVRFGRQSLCCGENPTSPQTTMLFPAHLTEFWFFPLEAHFHTFPYKDEAAL